MRVCVGGSLVANIKGKVLVFVRLCLCVHVRIVVCVCGLPTAQSQTLP